MAVSTMHSFSSPWLTTTLYKLGICPRLSWTLMVEEFPLTWLERCLQLLAIRFLKKWVGLAQPSNSVFLPKKRGGPALPLQVSLA